MGYIPNFSYVKSAYRDTDKEKMKFLRKKKKKVGELGVNLAEEPIKPLVNVHKQAKPFDKL